MPHSTKITYGYRLRQEVGGFNGQDNRWHRWMGGRESGGGEFTNGMVVESQSRLVEVGENC